MSGNTNKLYTSAGKCDYQLQFKLILEASMVSTPDIFIYNCPISPGPPMIVKKFSERKSLRLSTKVLGVKKKTSVCWEVSDKSKRKAIRAGIMLWSSIPKSKVHTRIN